MKFLKKLLPVVLSATLLFGVAGCGSKETGEKYEPYDYQLKHVSVDDIVHFFSSDSRFDSFMNEFFMRHMRYNDLRIHDFPVGAGQPVWKEWESMIGGFWNAAPQNLTTHYATNQWIKNWLTFDYMSRQDRQGYISTSVGITTDDWGQGWAFPSYKHNRSDAFGEEFTNNTNGWTGENGVTVKHASENNEGYLVAESASKTGEIAFVSPALNGGKGIGAFRAPFLHFSWQFKMNEGSRAADVEDLYVYFQTKDSGDTWSDDRCVKYSEYASVVTPFEKANGVAQGTFLNMFLNNEWGRDVANTKQITRLKFVLKAKDGQKIAGNMRFNFIRADFDDRLSSNCGSYIIAAKNYLSYARNKNLLTQILPVARGAMQFYLTHLDAAELGVISNAYLVGHFNSGKEGVGIGIGDGFWDAIAFPNVNLYSNLTFHQALKSMIYPEQMAADMQIEVPQTTVLGKDMQTSVAYRETAETLTAKLERCESVMREKFWDDAKGRFVAGNYDTEDGSSTTDQVMDYGFLMFNLQTVTDGIATPAQAERIMSWVCGERVIEGDTSTGDDIYKFLFAPRFSTKHNPTDATWPVGQAREWEIGVRNGGAVMQTSYYDLLARSMVKGGDNAFERLQGIEDFYYAVKAKGGQGMEFYREYFRDLGIGMQGNYQGGGDNEGPIGIDCEFLEAALLFVSVPDAFFGMIPQYDGTLSVQPNMPAALDYWRMENLHFGDAKYDLSIGKYFVQVSNIEEGNEGLKLQVKLPKPAFKFNLYYNDTVVQYREEGGYLVAEVPFANGKVEIKGA